MDEVYLARDSQLDRLVALKLLPSAYTCDENRLHRFIQEAKAASALNHPNIVTIYEIGESDVGRFIAMELIQCRILQAVSAARPSLESVVQFTCQVAKALHVAHAAAIVHRDRSE
jgi:eukaryotic-like serine/threonine-protein kinase